MTTYPREPAFWDRLDGDINAVAIPQLSGRSINSDVLALCEMTLAGSNLDKVLIASPNRLHDSASTSVIYNTDIPAVPRVETLLRWAEQHRDEVSDETTNFLSSLALADGIPRDEQCQSYVDSQDGVSVPIEWWESDKRMRRGIALLLWGGDPLISAMMPSQRRAPRTKASTDVPIDFVDGLCFYRNTLNKLLASEWRLDDSVSYREVALVSALLNENFARGVLSCAEIVFAVAHCRPLLCDIPQAGSVNSAQWDFDRQNTIELFRRAVNDDSALLWFAYFDSKISGYFPDRYKREGAVHLLGGLVDVAHQVPFMDALPFLEEEILDGDVIAGAVANGIDIDMVRQIAVA